MSWENTLSLALVIPLLGVRILSQVEWWQRKEYRPDRMRSMITSAEGRSLWSLWLLAGTVLAFVGMALSSVVGIWLGIASLITFILYDLQRFFRRGLFRPKATTKAKAIVGTALIACILILGSLIAQGVYGPSNAALLIVLLPLLVAISVAGINIPVSWKARRIIAAAKAKRERLQSLQVVGITGSFGKTSTKHFLGQVLADRDAVIVSSEHRNSALAIAQDMLKQLSTATKIYVTEMGAYRAGEIKELAALTRPTIGVLTAIGNQHVALFGSQEAVAAAKWELIDALPEDGIAVLNAASALVQARAKGLSKRVIWFAADQAAAPTDLRDQLAVYASHVTIHDRFITAYITIGSDTQQIQLSLLSEAMLSSAMAAAAAAFALNVPAPKIRERLTQLRPFPRTMELRETSSGITVIDDSYSANEQGVLTAIRHLVRFSAAKKLIVLTPIIELGQDGPAVHERIGAALAEGRASILLTSATYAEDIVRGGKQVRAEFSPQIAREPADLMAALSSHLTAGVVVLLEGRLPEVARKMVLR